MVVSGLLGPAISWGFYVALGGSPLDSHDEIFRQFWVQRSFFFNTQESTIGWKLKMKAGNKVIFL